MFENLKRKFDIRIENCPRMFLDKGNELNSVQKDMKCIVKREYSAFDEHLTDDTELKCDTELNHIKPDIYLLRVKKEDIRQILRYLKNSEEYFFERLDCMVCCDRKKDLEIMYLLQSDKYNVKCGIRVEIDKKENQIATVSDIFSNANLEEREIYDLFGIKFINHPDLKRIFMPEDFVGHPLRKDFIIQRLN